MKITYRTCTDIESSAEAWQCRSCQRLFGSKLQLKYHAKRIHGDRAPYICRGCKKPFRRIQELQKHSLQTLTCPASEGSGRSLSFWQAANCCLLCGAGGFRTLAGLRRHLGGSRHVNDIAYTCEHCSAGFLMVGELNLHRVTVHGELYGGAAFALGRKRRRSTVIAPNLLPAPTKDDDVDECVDEDGSSDARSHFSIAGGAGLKLVLKKVTPSADRSAAGAASSISPAFPASVIAAETASEDKHHRTIDSAEASDCEYEPASHTTADSGKGLSDQSDDSDSDACAAAAAATPSMPTMRLSTIAEQQPLEAAVNSDRQRLVASNGVPVPTTSVMPTPEPSTDVARPPLRLSIVIGREPLTAAVATSSSGGCSPAAATVRRLEPAAPPQESPSSACSEAHELIKKPRLQLHSNSAYGPVTPASATMSLMGGSMQPPAFGTELGAFAGGSSLLRAPTFVPSSPSPATAGPGASPRQQQPPPAFALSNRPHVPAFSFARPHEAFGIKAPSLLPPPPGAAATAAAAAAAVARQSDLFASAAQQPGSQSPLPSEVLGRMAGSSLLSRRLGTVGCCGPGSAVLAAAVPGTLAAVARLVPLSPLALAVQPTSSPAVQARLASAAAAATVAAAAAAATAASPSQDAGRSLLPPPSPARWPAYGGSRQFASPAYAPVVESQSRQQPADSPANRLSPAYGKTFAVGELPFMQLSQTTSTLPPPSAIAPSTIPSSSLPIDHCRTNAQDTLDGNLLPPDAGKAAGLCPTAASAQNFVSRLPECRLEQSELQQQPQPHAVRPLSSTLWCSGKVVTSLDLDCSSVRTRPANDVDCLGVDGEIRRPAAAMAGETVSSPPSSASAVASSATARRVRSGSQGSLDSRDSGLDYSPIGDLSHHSAAERPTTADSGPCHGIAATACDQCAAAQPLHTPPTPAESCNMVFHLRTESPKTSVSGLADAQQAASLSCSATDTPPVLTDASAETKCEASSDKDTHDEIGKAVAAETADGASTGADEAAERAVTAPCRPTTCGLTTLPPPPEPLIRCAADLSVPSLAVSVPLALLLHRDEAIASCCNNTTAPAATSEAIQPGRRQCTSQRDAVRMSCHATELPENFHSEEDEEDEDRDGLDVQETDICSDDDGSCYSDETDLIDRPSTGKLRFELTRDGCARTDCGTAVGQCRFVEDSLYLAHLRDKTCSMLLALFPSLRVGGSFLPHTCDVEDLVETVAEVLSRDGRGSGATADTSAATSTSEEHPLCTRQRLHCVSSLPSARRELGVRLCAVARQEVRRLQRGVCSLVQLVLPHLSWDELQADGICTFDQLLDAIVGAN